MSHSHDAMLRRISDALIETHPGRHRSVSPLPSSRRDSPGGRHLAPTHSVLPRGLVTSPGASSSAQPPTECLQTGLSPDSSLTAAAPNMFQWPAATLEAGADRE